jgi:heme-degrading monooxygenase HmoA
MHRLIVIAAAVMAAMLSPSFAQDAKLRPGPAAWIEEYWDVKPERFEEFVAVYRRDVYTHMRKIPGYRGYTLLTTMPDEGGFPDNSNPRLRKTITPHYAIQLDGKVLTERLFDVGNLLRMTHNVVVAHSLQTWTDADNFRAAFARAYANANSGADVNEHLAKTLYPLANNMWISNFRLALTGEAMPTGAAARGSDADGLNLEPRPSKAFWGKEYFDVDAKSLKAFLAAYEGNTYQVMRMIPGYKGVTIVMNQPPAADEARITRYTGQPLGTANSHYVPHPGVMMDGAIRTNISYNFALMFNQAYTLITYFQVPQGIELMKEMQANYDKLNPNGGDRIKLITRVLFPHVRNHWDMFYRAVETSFVPTMQGASP